MAKKAHPVPPVQINVVAEGTVLEGTLYVKEDMRVSGRIVGTVTAKKRVVVAPEGSIDGEVVAAVVDVFGSVHGELDVAEHLILRSGARVEGSLKTGQFTVEKGAVFNGTCRMGQGATPPQADKAEAPTLPDWVDVLQKEAASEKAVLLMPVPEPPKWAPAPLKQSPEAPDDAPPSLAEPVPLPVEEAEALAPPVTLQAGEAEIAVPPSPVDAAPPERVHEEPRHETAPAEAQPSPLPVPATAAGTRPQEKASPEQEQPSSKRGTPVMLGIFLVAVLTVGGYYGLLRGSGQDPSPSGQALAASDTLADTPPVDAPITEAALLSSEDEAEDVSAPPDEPVADAADPQATEQERLATEPALDDEDALLDQADAPEATPDNRPETTEVVPEPGTEQEDTAAVKEEIRSAVERLTRHLKASIEGENISGMDALFYRGWAPFFEEANATIAAVRSENVQVSGTQATVEVYLDLDYQDTEDQRRQSARSYRWTLRRLSDGWVLMRVRAQ